MPPKLTHMFGKRAGLRVGVDSEKVFISREGVYFDGIPTVDGRRAYRAQRDYAWDDLGGIDIFYTPSRALGRIMAAVDLLPLGDDAGTDDKNSLYGHATVTVYPRNPAVPPASMQIPLRLRWHPNREWFARLQNDARRSITEPAVRESFS